MPPDLGILDWGVSPGSPNPDPISNQNMPFSDLCCSVSYEFSLNDIVWILLFLYYSFGVEKTNTFIRSLCSLENHTRFQTKTAQKPYPLGRYIYQYSFIGEYPPPRGDKQRCFIFCLIPDTPYIKRNNLKPVLTSSVCLLFSQLMKRSCPAKAGNVAACMPNCVQSPNFSGYEGTCSYGKCCYYAQVSYYSFSF